MDRDLEEQAYAKGFKRPVGIDEAGRGPLAGPVVAAACFIPISNSIDGIADSKTLSHLKREKLYRQLLEDPEIDIGIAVVSHEEIDQINILQASMLAMLKATEELNEPADYLLIDGNREPSTSVICETVVKGDSKVLSIAAASIIAKFYRDELMMQYHEIYPEYGFDKHKGYPTKAHYDAIRKFGACPIHRMSFKGVLV